MQRLGRVVLLLCLVVFAIMMAEPGTLLQAGYRALRMTASSLPVFGREVWLTAESEQFTLYYQAADQSVADGVLLELEESWQALQLDWSSHAPEQVVVFLYPSEAQLQAALGQTGGATLGAYQLGRLHLLSPLAWQPQATVDEALAAYRQSGPVVHELTHLLLDYQVSGNTPLWFSEGMAEYWEWRLGGYIWAEPGLDWRQGVVTVSELNDQFSSGSEYAAYRQSLSVVQYLYDTVGEAAMSELVAALGQGIEFEAALQTTVGGGLEQLESAWRLACLP